VLGIPVEFVFFDDLGINFTVIQVVRRFGDVGGMDSYVWQLSHALVNLGVPVIVLCEEALHPHSPEIYVIRVKKARKKPRGLSFYRFGLRA
jgi:UDP-glucose:(heptosyl)LPS alpha-1,3-glucosyltransferase